MIRFGLACKNGHRFDGWFGSSGAFDDQVKRKLVACPQCASTDVSKALMAPAVSTARRQETAKAEMRTAIVQGMARLRDQITRNADDVGAAFPEEARRIHYGECAPRAIYGAAKPRDVEELLEEGIGIAPLPVLPEDAN